MRYQQRAAPPPGDEPLEFVMSDATLDRAGDIIEPSGWELDNFQQHPVALFNHLSNQIVGKWENVRVKAGKLIGKLVLADKGTSPLVDTVRELVRQNMLRAVSVGFRDLEREPIDETADEFWGPFRFTKSELLECSLVAVPANPNALQIAKSLGLPPAGVAALFAKSGTEHAAARAGTTPASQPQRRPQQTGAKSMATLSQRIESARTELVAMRDRLADLTEKTDLTEAEQLEMDELAGDGSDESASRIKHSERALQRLEAAEKAIAGSTAGAGGHVPPATSRSIRVPKKVEPIDYFFRVATCFALAKANRAQDPIEFLRDRYKGDEMTGHALAYVMRAAPGPALTTQATWAAELVQQGFADFMSTLKPFSLYPVLAGKGTRMSFGPGAGTIKLPFRSATPTVAGAFVGEAQPIPVKKLGLTSKTMTPCKMAVISMFSEEIANRSTPQIEGLLRQEMTEDTQVAIDTALIDAVAETVGVRPAGLRSGVAGLTPTAAGTNTEKMVADLKQLVGAITAVNGGRDIVVLLNPLQSMSLGFAQTTTGAFLFSSQGEAQSKFNVTFASSNTVPAGMLIAVDAADFASATGDTPRFRLSAEATVHDEDTTPLAIGTPGAPATVAAPVRSFFQTDVMGIRMIWDMYWTMRRAGMVAWMTGVTW